MLSLDWKQAKKKEEEEPIQRLPKWHEYTRNALSSRGVQIVQLMNIGAESTNEICAMLSN